MRKVLFASPVVVALIAIGAISAGAHGGHQSPLLVKVPAEDRFTPFAATIHAGDSVRWVNNDADGHTVVSDDAFNTAGHKGVDRPLPASGGTVTLRFDHPGTFVYYCRFHARLDSAGQPVAPGPEGGIQNPNGNFGTPMSGVVTVLPRGGDQNGDVNQGH
jgi:plastocyanin